MPKKYTKEIKSDLAKFFKGDVDSSRETLDEHSRDASLFEVKPQLVVYPKHANDVEKLVAWANNSKSLYPELSLTARSAGTCMAGGSLNKSIIVDVTRYMNAIHHFHRDKRLISAQPGVYYRDFEAETLKYDLLYPAFPASKSICALGGIVGNNGAGEKTLRYGKCEDYVESLRVVFSNGHEYDVKPLNRAELSEKLELAKKRSVAPAVKFEAKLYKQIYDLIESNYDLIKDAKPKVSKNSAGYFLWNVWDRDTGIFDLTKLIVGSQGTLGITTDITMKLVPVEKKAMMVAVFMHDLEHLGSIVNDALAFEPESVEAYDDKTMKLALRFWAGFIKKRGLWGAIKLGLSFLPELGMLIKGMPQLVLLVNFTGNDEAELLQKVKDLEAKLKPYKKVGTRRALSAAKAEKYWTIRHDSFALLRSHFQDKRTAPFIDDVIVPPEVFPEFLPRLTAILAEYDMFYNIHGHAGNGNFHIVPLMDWNDNFAAKTILEISDRVYDLVLEYQGSITAEHNDGIIRTPYLERMYGADIIKLFQKTKDIFDPNNIFNPGKKVGGTFADIKRHLIKPKKK